MANIIVNEQDIIQNSLELPQRVQICKNLAPWFNSDHQNYQWLLVPCNWKEEHPLGFEKLQLNLATSLAYTKFALAQP